MSFFTHQHSSADTRGDKSVQLVNVCYVYSAVNESYKTLKKIPYASGDPENDRVLTSFQVFLCKLALICDNTKGGDNITALVALKAANGPDYRFASNNRREMDLKDAKKFLEDLLKYVGENPGNLGEKPMQKQILWRALEFNMPKIKFYISQTLHLLGECIDLHTQFDGNSRSDIVTQLRSIEALAMFRCDVESGENARNKCLNNCEKLIKAVQHAKETGFSKTMQEFTRDRRSKVAHAWSQLRHCFGRLHSYRQAADCIFKAWQKWPELFSGFTVSPIHSSRPKKVALPRNISSLEHVLQTAFPGMDMAEYNDSLEELRDYGLEENIRHRLRQKTLPQFEHCEVRLHSFLVRNGKSDASDYWNECMFIATSKQPCRLCHHYFEDADNDFQVQSSHMNVYPKWRLPEPHEGQDDDEARHQEELLDEIIEQMQQDILSILRSKLPQGKRNDSRTESRGMVSAASGQVNLERQHVPERNSGRFSAGTKGYYRAQDSDVISETSSYDDLDEGDFQGTVTLGAAISRVPAGEIASGWGSPAERSFCPA